MPAKKSARVQERRRIINRRVRSSTRTAVKKAVRIFDAGDTEQAAPATAAAISALDRAASKGVLHANNVARHKSRLMKRLNATAS